MHIAYLLLGGNLGNREGYLREAMMELEQKVGKIIRHSSIYETAAWGKTDQEPFLNQAIELETELSAEDLMSTLLSIETNLGRTRTEQFGPRTIDIDILLYDNIIQQCAHVTLPHPQLHNRRFALEPLSELIPEYRHPLLGQRIRDLLDTCNDPLPVHKMAP